MIYLILTIATVFNTAIWLSNVQKEQDAAAKDLDRETKKLIKAKYQRKQRGILALCGGINIALLLMLKYSPFAATNINTLLRLMGASYQIRVPSFIIPIGISFYRDCRRIEPILFERSRYRNNHPHRMFGHCI